MVERLDDALTELADGNLAYRIADPMAADYERLRVAFNRTMEALGETLLQVSETSQTVSCGASEIHAAAGDLSQRTEYQANRLEAAAHALNEVTALVSRTATGTFTQEIRGLEAGQRYQFQAIVKHPLLTLTAKDVVLTIPQS